MSMSSHNLAKLALAEPKSRQDCIALAEGIIAKLKEVSGLIEAAIDRCEAQAMKRAA